MFGKGAKERLVPVAPDEGDRFFGQQVRQVAVPLDRLLVLVKAGLAALGQVMVVADGPHVVADKMLEAMRHRRRIWLVAQVPFPIQRRPVTCVIQMLRQRRILVTDAVALGADVGLETDARRIPAGQQRRPRRTTHRCGCVEIRHAHTFGGYAPDRWCSDVRCTIGLGVGVTHVVRHDQDDIGPSILCMENCGENPRQE